MNKFIKNLLKNKKNVINLKLENPIKDKREKSFFDIGKVIVLLFNKLLFGLVKNYYIF